VGQSRENRQGGEDDAGGLVIHEKGGRRHAEDAKQQGAEIQYPHA
jgi:hypothetical protein